MIKTDIIGNLGQDAVVNNVNGKNVINFSLAHTEKYKDAQGVQHDKTLWVRAAYWANSIAIAPYLKKGTMVFVSGQPEVGTYQDKQGKWQSEFKLRVTQIQLLGSKEGNAGGNTPQGSGSQQPQASPTYYPPHTAYQNPNDITEPVDDLPF